MFDTWMGRCPGEGNGYSLQYCCLENSMDRGAWRATGHRGCKELDIIEQLSFSLSCIGGGNGNPCQCSCLENPRDGGAWWAAVYGVAQTQTRLKRLSSSSSTLKICYTNVKMTLSGTIQLHYNYLTCSFSFVSTHNI